MQDLKGASLKTIENLCSKTISQDAPNTPLQINIPLLQRPYSWNKDNIVSLINDYLLNFRTNPESKYFVGSVVIISNDNNPRIDIVDGQQRLTTMFLLNYIRYCLLVHLISDSISRKKLFEARDRIKEDLPSVLSLLMNYDIKTISKLCADIKSVGEDDSRKNNQDEIDTLVKTFNELVGMPYPIISDDYPQAWINSSRFNESQLAITYSRNKINTKLKSALSSNCVYYDYNRQPVLFSTSQFAKDYVDHRTRLETATGQDKVLLEKRITEIVNKYSALDDENRYSLAIAYAKNTPEEKTIEILRLISDLLSQLQMCSVVTCETEDAYTLFEVLNDRALEIPDLDLIKDKFLRKYYVGHCGESNCDSIIETTDDRWHAIFDGLSATKCSLISYYSVSFIHADPELDNKNIPRFRKYIQRYLESKDNYAESDLCSDVDVYEMIKDIIDKFLPASSEKYIASNIAENSNESSIVDRAVKLIHALGYDKVKSSLFNIIIQGYFEYKNEPYSKNSFNNYLTNLQNQLSAHRDYYRVCDWAFFYWRTCIMSANKDKPLMIARKVIRNIHKDGSNLSTYNPAMCINELNQELSITNPGETFESKLEQEFSSWITSWDYDHTQIAAKHKVRILLIDLFKYDLDTSTNTLVLPAVVRSFTEADKIDLDHLEPETPDTAVDSSEYYFGNDVNNQVRKTMIHSLGNMMVIDKPANIRMSNIPLYQALAEYYCNPNEHYSSHLVNDINTYLDSNHNESVLGNKVPTDGFFSNRRNRLIAYCKALLRRGSFNDSITI